MSHKPDKIIHIVVVGVSGPESLRGAVGVGKSSLCNRFIRPLADDYQPEDHISTISQSDFSGRVINNDHFLYWGNVTKRNEEGVEVHFSVIEQTEFVDDQSFAPLRGSNTQQYHKRCAATKLTSAEKLMYICKYQLGEEDGYDKVVLPEPKFTVDGYIMVFDVNSKVRGRPVQKQLEFLGVLQQALAKTKRPLLVVATKCDEADDHYLKEARSFAAKIKAPIVETSANEAVNVDLAFMTLAQLIDRTKGRPREVPFADAIKTRKELLDNVTDAYAQLLKNDVTDYHTLWKSKMKEYKKTKHPYLSYVMHLGTPNAKKMFDRHKKKLKEEHLRKKQLQYLTMLPKALEDIFPDLEAIADRTWEQCKVNLNEHLQFQQWFIMLDEEWKFSPYIDSSQSQIPYDFLDTNNEECKTVFTRHVDRLQAIKRKERMKADFKKLLIALKDVITPGRKLEDTETHFANEESYRELTKEERKVIYDRHQDEIKKAATNSFMEMLYEKADLFERFENMDRGNYVEEAREVEEALQSEKRYKALSELKNERKVMLYKHIAFMHNPTKETCPSRDRCMDRLIQTCVEYRVPKSPVKDPVNKWSDTNGKLNVVLLGEDGLADELANEIRQQSCDDDYTLDGALHSLDLRPIDGDVSQPRNYLSTDNFTPQGCICTFTSPLSFQYVKTCLEKTLLATNNDERYATLRNLPVVLMYARDVSVPDSDLWHLKEDALKLQDRLNQCMIIEMPTEESVIWHGKKFHESQIQKAFRFIVNTKKLSEGLDNMDGLDDDEPDLRIGMALMCGDQFLPDLVLGPLLGHDTCFQTPDLEQSITVDLFLGTERKKIDVDVMSYHQNTLYREDIHHGYILVYSTKRKASFETMKTFLDSIDSVPTLIVGVLDMDKSPDYETQVLRLEGHNLAESKENCRFLPAGPAIQGQPLAYSIFLKDVYDKRNETEEIYEFVQDTPGFDNRFQARTPSLSEDDYAQPQQYRTPEKPRMPGYESENMYDTFNRPSPFSRTAIQSVPIKERPPGSPYGQINKPATLPRRHSDIGERPLEELYATPDKSGRLRTATDVVEGSHDKEMYATVNKSHKRTGSGGAGSAEQHVEEEEGWVDCNVYDTSGMSMNQQRRSLPPDDSNALYAVVPRGGGDGEESSMMKNPIYDSVEQQPKKKPPPPIKPKPQRQRVRGKTPSTGDSPSDGDLHTPPGLNKTKKKPLVPPRSSIKSPPNLPDNALINELKGVIGEDTTPRSRSFGSEDPARHTSSDSDSRSSMDAINKDPICRRKRSYRRRREPKTRAANIELEYPFHERIYEPQPPVSPSIVGPEETHEVKKTSKEARKKKEKEDKRIKKEEERKARALKKKNKRRGAGTPQQPAPPQKPKGPPIETLVSPGVLIPPFVVVCLEYIEQEGLRTEGVYRVPGKGVDSDTLINKFEEEKSVNISDMEISVHAVATAIKQFFSQLPEPLVPRTTQEEFLDQFKVVGSENFRSALPELLDKLPQVNRNVFSYMMLHLNKIMQQSDVNKMTAENLSTCWWPTLLQPQYKSLEDMANHAPLQNVVITCIQDAPELFGHINFFPPEESPEADLPEAFAESDTSMTTPIEE